MKEQQYYFSHDASAKDDPKCTYLIESLGLEGYGIFWVLVETLRSQPDFKYPLKLIPALARKYNTTTDKIQVVVKGYELFEIEEDQFFSLSLNRRMQDYENKRLKHSLGGKKGMENRWNSDKLLITNLQESYNHDITIKEKKRKEKENKKEEILCGEAEKNSASSPPENIIFEFETKKDSKGQNKIFYICQNDLLSFQNAFNSLDVMQELNKVYSWYKCNPDKKKTTAGMPKFLFTWLNKANQQQEIKNEFSKNRYNNGSKQSGFTDLSRIQNIVLQ